MQTRIALTLGAVLVAAAARMPTRVAPVAQAAPGVAQPSSTLDDQVELAVTVYNSDIALVRDVRNVQLPQGTFDLRYMDVAATVNPSTVHFRSLTEPSRVNVLEQNYEMICSSPTSCCEIRGRDVTLVRRRSENGETREEEVKARFSATTTRPSGRLAARSSPGWAPITSNFRAPRQPLHASHADLDARQRRRAASSGRGVVSGEQAVVERGLCPDRRA
jgi:hypothetical protein